MQALSMMAIWKTQMYIMRVRLRYLSKRIRCKPLVGAAKIQKEVAYGIHLGKKSCN